MVDNTPSLPREQAIANSACQCCGLVSPDGNLQLQSSLLMGNSIELEQLDSAGSSGCIFCQFLARLFRFTVPEQYQPARFRFSKFNGILKLHQMSFQPFQEPSGNLIDIFRFNGTCNEMTESFELLHPLLPLTSWEHLLMTDPRSPGK